MTTFIKSTLVVFAAMSMLACGNKEEKTAPEAVYESERGGATEMSATEKIALGKKLFEGKGTCFSCHMADKKVIGPSVKEIVEVYEKHNADLVSFLKGNEEAIVDPSQFIIMQANFTITKKMSDVELESIVAYMKTM